jgi:elongation factor P
MLEYSEIRVGKIIIYEDEPCEVLDNHVARTQMRKPQNQVKLKNLISGRALNATFHAADKVDEADINKREVKFLYTNKGEYWFANPTDLKDRFQIAENIIGEARKFLKTNELVTAIIWDNDDEEQIIKVSLPIKMEFAIKEAPPSIRGNTANGGGKLAILENGMKIQVPFFVEAGDKVVVNTDTGEYVERVGK